MAVSASKTLHKHLSAAAGLAALTVVAFAPQDAKAACIAAEDFADIRLPAACLTPTEGQAVRLRMFRADLAVAELAGGMPAESCSTGEQKALLICIVLAHARVLAKERGAPPLLLLDEVAAHLDPRRREALYEELLALGAQAWMTGTEASLFRPLKDRAQFFRVLDGAAVADA